MVVGVGHGCVIGGDAGGVATIQKWQRTDGILDHAFPLDERDVNAVESGIWPTNQKAAFVVDANPEYGPLDTLVGLVVDSHGQRLVSLEHNLIAAGRANQLDVYDLDFAAATALGAFAAGRSLAPALAQRIGFLAVHIGQICIDDLGRIAKQLHFAAFQPHRVVAQRTHRVERVRHKHNRFTLLAKCKDTLHAFALECFIAHRQYFIGNQHIWIDGSGDGKG